MECTLKPYNTNDRLASKKQPKKRQGSVYRLYETGNSCTKLSNCDNCANAQLKMCISTCIPIATSGR